MSVANLNFTGTYSPPASNAVGLNFGSNSGPTVDPADLALVITLAAPVWSSTLLYDSNVSRPVGILPDFIWQPAIQEEQSKSGGWGYAQIDRQYTSVPWNAGAPTNKSAIETHGVLSQDRQFRASPWSRAQAANAKAINELFVDLARDRRFTKLPWELAGRLGLSSGDGFVQLYPFKHNKVSRWQEAAYLSRVEALAFNHGKDFAWWTKIPWEEGRKPPPGRELPYVPPVEPPYDPDYNLNFRCKCTFPDPLNVLLNFGLDPCPGSVEAPARKVYFIVNSISLKRVSDNVPVDILGASVGIDNNSWCWSFGASIPYHHLDRIEPTSLGPVEVELEINGIIWRFLVEEYDEKKQFGKTDISIKGRSVTAYLESPYAPVRSFTQSTSLTSRQFAEAELTRAGLITGFTLDWQLIDALGWQMPANTWSYSDLTPIQVIQAIAQGAGGFVNSHPSDKQLLVLPEYPAAAWEWASATIAKSIPKTLIKNQNLRWTEKPLYNGVYVSGENTGVTDFIKRAGTDGAFQAPMFVSPMISDHAASRNKGVAILSAGGKQAQVGLELPMEPTLGLLTPGMMIEVTNGGYGTETAWRGLVRSTAISAAWGNGLTVSQSIDLERHYGGL
jgi:hypothetical protein